MKLMSLYTTNPKLVWEIIFLNLCANSEICHWFHSTIGFERLYARAEIDVILRDSYPELKGRTLSNPLNSLINTFKESSLSSNPQLVALVKESGKLAIMRKIHNDVSIVAVAYSLYLYAERKDRRSLTVSEFFRIVRPKASIVNSVLTVQYSNASCAPCKRNGTMFSTYSST